MNTKQRMQRSANVHPETQAILAKLLNNYFSQFGLNRIEQNEHYTAAKVGIMYKIDRKYAKDKTKAKKYHFNTLYNIIRCVPVQKNTVRDVMLHFGLEIDNEVWQSEEVIKHVENEG